MVSKAHAQVRLLKVMLKDMADSKRLNTSIQALPASASVAGRSRRKPPDLGSTSALVLSGLFWPNLSPIDDTPKLHPKVCHTRPSHYHIIVATVNKATSRLCCVSCRVQLSCVSSLRGAESLKGCCCDDTRACAA